MQLRAAAYEVQQTVQTKERTQLSQDQRVGECKLRTQRKRRRRPEQRRSHIVAPDGERPRNQPCTKAAFVLRLADDAGEHALEDARNRGYRDGANLPQVRQQLVGGVTDVERAARVDATVSNGMFVDMRK